MADIVEPPVEFPFPFPPYEIQKELMTHVFQAFEEGKLAILESPTGTGKSLSLICGALAWLDQHNTKQKSRLERALAACAGAVSVCESQDDWFSAAADRQHQVQAAHALREQLADLQAEQQRVQDIVNRVKKRKQAELDVQGNNTNGQYPDYSDAKRKGDLSSEEQELVLDDEQQELPEEQLDQQQGFKIYYCSRTHSQLSQFVGELQKTIYGGSATRVAVLASRQNLCINPDVSALKSSAMINDRCLELQQQKKKPLRNEATADGSKRRKTAHGCRCPYNNTQAVRALADEVLCEVMDLEEVVRRGRTTRACPYYAARTALPDAQVVVVPYNSVLQESTRAACGVQMKGNALIVDEAHNLLGTLASVQEITISYHQVCTSRREVLGYVQRYETRLSARNTLHLNQILFVLKTLLSVMQTKKSGVGSQVPDGELLTVASFLSSCGVDNINLSRLVQFCTTSHLPHKLHGFSRLFQGGVQATPAAPDKTSTASFLSSMAAGAEMQCSSALTPDTTSTAEQEAFTGGGNCFLQFVELLQRLMSTNSSGRVLVHREALLKNATIKYIVLDPAAHFHQLVRECRCVILAGGTMKPLQEFSSQLFLSAGAAASRVLEYTCGHVVPADNIMPVVLTAGPTGKRLDLTHVARQHPDMVREVGRVLLNVCSVVPGGVVVFLPSYSYAEHLLNTLKQQGILENINKKKKVLSEPRGSAVAAVWKNYTATIKAGAGALLFCVVGGKMSEGINFSDALGRCVVMVGLPYPNSTSPELKERMKHLDATQSPSGGVSAGAAYYHNLCFRAVNQSIGRAIRHRGDYATILLLEQRYSRPSTIASLPDWITRALVITDKFPPAQAAIAKFFSRHKRRMEQSTAA